MARANYLQSHRKPDGCCATRHARRGISREIEGIGERNPVDGFHLHTPHFARRLPNGKRSYGHRGSQEKVVIGEKGRQLCRQIVSYPRCRRVVHSATFQARFDEFHQAFVHQRAMLFEILAVRSGVLDEDDGFKALLRGAETDLGFLHAVPDLFKYRQRGLHYGGDLRFDNGKTQIRAIS